ncbi:MAG: hypothetical protein EP343_14030 [Deltaproteobacteria bacterium]|nr:MAG: hypothetical protein EP343_14030 [Deltaproteobacteria bacterium]
MLEIVKIRDTFPAKVRDLEKQLASEQSKLAKTQASFDTIHDERTEKHNKFKEDDERLKKWERRLNESKNAREASALAREIDAHKRLNQELEEEVLKLMEQEELEKASLTSFESTIQEIEEKLAKERAVCEEKLGDLNQQIAVFESDRQQYVEQLPKPLLRRYEGVKRARGGLAVVEVRNGCCTGCNMRLRPQLHNTVLKGKSLETCPGCKRMLYHQEEGAADAS